MTEKHQCSEKVWFQYGSHLCEIPAIVERDGKWYCKIHDPAQIKALPELIEALKRYDVNINFVNDTNPRKYELLGVLTYDLRNALSKAGVK